MFVNSLELKYAKCQGSKLYKRIKQFTPNCPCALFQIRDSIDSQLEFVS